MVHTKQTRRIARLILALAALPGIGIAADPPAIRVSAPTLVGWVTVQDGSQIIEIAGIAESPRAGRTVALPSAARRFWASPDGKAVLVRLDTGLFLLKSNDQVELLVEISPDSDVTAAWDRSSAGFAICWAEICQARAADGAIRAQWEVPAGSHVAAFSVDAGLVTATGGGGEWRGGSGVIHLNAAPAAAAFRSGTRELWLHDETGHLIGQDQQGRRIGEGELVPNALGLVSSLDGKSFFSANVEGAAAVFSLDSFQTERLSVPDTVEGVWPV